jgi:hypothetical protein
MLTAIRKEAYFETSPQGPQGLFHPFTHNSLPYGALEVLEWYWPRFLAGEEVDVARLVSNPKSSYEAVLKRRWENIESQRVGALGSLMGLFTDALTVDLQESRGYFESHDERALRVCHHLAASTILFGHVHWTSGECQDVEDVMRLFYGGTLHPPKGPEHAKFQQNRIAVERILRSRKKPVEFDQTGDAV